MKKKEFLGGLIMCIGIMIMCFGSNPNRPDAYIYEVAARLFGLALLAGGAWLGDMFDKGDSKVKVAKDNEGYDKQDDHNPYPEE